MSLTLAAPVTYDELLAMPDDGRRYELINGELIVSPAPSADHQGISSALNDALKAFVRSTKAGIVRYAPMDVKISSYSAVQPDLLFIRADRVSKILSRGIVTAAPDLVVEILSPSTREVDQVRKFGFYAGIGVSEYWIVDPVRKTVAVHALADGQYEPVPRNDRGEIVSRVLPGFTLDPALCFVDELGNPLGE